MTILCDKFDFLQDQGLDVIAEGLDTLKDMARDMNEVSFVPCLSHFLRKITRIEFYSRGRCKFNNISFFQELDRQVPLMDEIDDKVILSLCFSIYFFLFAKIQWVNCIDFFFFLAENCVD